MNKNLDEFGKTNHFKVPEKYFENFSDNLISSLPEKENRKPEIISLWDRFKPWAYMAAMFVGIMLMVNIFVNNSKENGILSEDVHDIPVAQIDEFYSFYEDQVADHSYRQVLYQEEM